MNNIISKKWALILIFLVLAASGCSGTKEKETSPGETNSTVEETENLKADVTENLEAEIAEEDSEDGEWPPVGTSWKSTNPDGETISMVITGIEVVDGVEMCKAVYESNGENEEFAKVEYLWSKNGEKVIWTAYDKEGNVVYKYNMDGGKITGINKDGQTFEYQEGNIKNN